MTRGWVLFQRAVYHSTYPFFLCYHHAALRKVGEILDAECSVTLMTLGIRVIYTYGRVNLTWSPSSQQRGVVPGLLRLPCQARLA